MDIPDELSKTNYKKAPKLKNLRRGSFTTFDVKDTTQERNTLHVGQSHAKQRRASFGNALAVDLANTIKKSKSSDCLSKEGNKPKSKKKILERFRSVDESKDLKSPKKSGLTKLLKNSPRTTSLDLTTEELLMKHKEKSKQLHKMEVIPEPESKPKPPKKPTTLTGKKNRQIE